MTGPVAAYRRAFGRHRTVLLRRLAGTGEAVAEVAVRARVTGYEPRDLVGDVRQGDRRVLLLAEDIGAFPVPVEVRGRDRIVLSTAAGEQMMMIEALDDQSRRLDGVLLAYEIRVRG